MVVNYVFMVCFSSFSPSENPKTRTSNYAKYMHTLRTEGLELPMKVKDIPKFEKLNTRNLTVLELTGTVSTLIHINTNIDQPR